MIANLTPAYLLYWQVRIQMYSKSENIYQWGQEQFFRSTGIKATACAFLSLFGLPGAWAKWGRVPVEGRV